jgi:hypothetical protein
MYTDPCFADKHLRVIGSAAKNPAGWTHAAALLDSSLALRRTEFFEAAPTPRLTNLHP